MTTFKKLLVGFCAFLLAICLFLGLTTLSITNYLGSPEHIKTTLKEAHVYDSLVDNVLTNLEKKQQNQSSEDIPLNDPQIQAAIKKALPPEFWQTSAEQIIDSAYAWLNGETTTIEFSIDLKPAKTTFINSVADYAVTRMAKLPVCLTPVQVSDANDLLNAACKPPNFDANLTKQKFISEAQNSKFLGDSTTISPKNLKSDDGKTLEDKLIMVKQGYTFSKQLPIFLYICAIVLTVIIFLLNEERVNALRKLRSVYLSTGISVLIFSGIGWFVFKKVSIPSIKIGDSTNARLQTDIISAANSIFDAVIGVLLIGGIIYTIIGILCWLIAKKISPILSDELKQNNVNKILKTKELNDDNAVNLESSAEKSTTNKKETTTSDDL